MVEKDPVAKRKIKYGGIFDFKETYRFAYMWFVDNGYDLIEKSYTEKIGGRGKEIEIEWAASKKISDYFKFAITAKWRILGLNDAEVEDNGKKVKMNSGDVEIAFTCTLEKDYEARWENNPFFKFLRDVYNRYIIRARIEAYETKLFFELDELNNQIKSYLALTAR